MRVCHSFDPVFDDPNLIAYGGLPAVMRLAEQAGLYDLVDEHVTVPGTAGANTSAKVSAIIAGLVVGADSISDLDVLRHGGMGRVFTGLRAPTTLGTHLRAYRFGHVRQLDAVAARLLARLAAVSPILAGAEQVTYLDVDDTIRETHGYHKQGAAYGYSKVKGLNAQVAILSTPPQRPGDRRHEVAEGQHRLRPWSGPLDRRQPGHPAAGDHSRPGRRARRLGVLPARRGRRRPRRRREVLGHRPPQQGRDQGDRRYRPTSLDRDRLPERGLRRRATTLDL